MKSIKIIIAVLAFSALSFAQNYTDALLVSQPGLFSSARALGMGNSYTALSNDYSAVVFNPAGLGLAKKMGLSLAFDLNSFNNSSSFFETTNNSSQSTFNLSQFGFVFPVPTVQGSLVFALGYNRTKEFNSITKFDALNKGNNSFIRSLSLSNNDVPYYLYLSYPLYDGSDTYIKDTTNIFGGLNQSGDIKAKGRLSNWSFASSIEVAKDLFIGGTFNIISGNYKKDRNYYENDYANNYTGELVPGESTTNDFQTFYLNDIIDWDISGWDFKLGVLYNWKNYFRFGADIKFPSHYTIKESYYIATSSDFASTSYDYSTTDNIEYSIQSPYEYSIGGAIMEKMFTVSAGIKVADYSQMEFTDGLGDDRTKRNQEISDLFRLAPTYNIGAEVNLPSSPITLRIGGIYNKSPYADDPAEFDKKYLTAGAGLLLGDDLRVDFGYAFGWWKDFIDNYDSNISRVYHDINVHNLVLTVTTGIN